MPPPGSLSCGGFSAAVPLWHLHPKWDPQGGARRASRLPKPHVPSLPSLRAGLSGASVLSSAASERQSAGAGRSRLRLLGDRTRRPVRCLDLLRLTSPSPGPLLLPRWRAPSFLWSRALAFALLSAGGLTQAQGHLSRLFTDCRPVPSSSDLPVATCPPLPKLTPPAFLKGLGGTAVHPATVSRMWWSA